MQWGKNDDGDHVYIDARGFVWKVRKEWRRLGGEAWRIFGGPDQLNGARYAPTLTQAKAKVERAGKG